MVRNGRSPLIGRYESGNLGLFSLTKSIINQLTQCVHGLGFIGPFGSDLDFSASSGCEHHQAHDGLAIDTFAMTVDGNLTGKL